MPLAWQACTSSSHPSRTASGGLSILLFSRYLDLGSACHPQPHGETCVQADLGLCVWQKTCHPHGGGWRMNLDMVVLGMGGALDNVAGGVVWTTGRVNPLPFPLPLPSPSPTTTSTSPTTSFLPSFPTISARDRDGDLDHAGGTGMPFVPALLLLFCLCATCLPVLADLRLTTLPYCTQHATLPCCTVFLLPTPHACLAVPMGPGSLPCVYFGQVPVFLFLAAVSLWCLPCLPPTPHHPICLPPNVGEGRHFGQDGLGTFSFLCWLLDGRRDGRTVCGTPASCHARLPSLPPSLLLSLLPTSPIL